jgi:hypothetical protein
MDDEEIDELILSRLRQHRAQQSGGPDRERGGPRHLLQRARTPYPEPRIQNRLRALADQGLIKESAAAPDRWMIVVASDPQRRRLNQPRID